MCSLIYCFEVTSVCRNIKFFEMTIHNKTSEIWKQIESSIQEDLPPCIVKILEETGFNNSVCINTIGQVELDSIEKYVNDSLRHVVDGFDCCHSEAYQNQKVFRFLPGHRALILNLKNYLDKIRLLKSSSNSVNNTMRHYNEFTFVLKTMIETAERNAGKVPTQYRYSEIIRYFAIYIYMTCGKLCYETLSKNLPLPQPSSICEFFLNKNYFKRAKRIKFK